MTIVSLTFLFLVTASKLRPVGQTFALVVAYALDLLGSIPAGEIATRGLLYAWLFVGIPAGATILVNLLIGPAPRALAQRMLAARLRLAVAVLRDPGAAWDGRLDRTIKQGNDHLMGLLRVAGLESSAPPRDLAALRQAAEASLALLLALDFQARAPDAALPEPLRGALADTIGRMAEILAAGGYPVQVALEPVAVLAPLADPAYREIAQALSRFAEPPSAPSQAAKAKSGFLLPDAFTNPDHLRYAVKTTAAAMFCYLLFSVLDWPGIHTCFLTCYIVSLGTAGETIEKLFLRIAGCLMGAAMGLLALIFLVPHLDTITALLALVFLGSLVSGWVAAGSPRISYAGFQIAFAFFLCVIQGAAPAYDMVVARDRVIGILIGNLVTYIVFTRIWPVSLKGQIEAAIAGLMRKLGALSAAQEKDQQRRLAAEIFAGLGALEENLDIVRYEPAAVRPAPAWLVLRRQAAQKIGALAGPLLLLPERDAPLAQNAQPLARLIESRRHELDDVMHAGRAASAR